MLTIFTRTVQRHRYTDILVQSSQPSALYAFLKWKHSRVSNGMNAKQVYNVGLLTWGPRKRKCEMSWSTISGGLVVTAKMLRNVARVLCGSSCKWWGPYAVFPSPRHAHLCPFFHTWGCDSLPPWDGVNRRRLPFEAFSRDPHHERTPAASLCAPHNHAIDGRGLLIFDSKINTKC